MLDQIPVLLLQTTDFHHPLFDLSERTLEIRGHLIERIGQFLDFVPGLEFEPPLQPSAANFLHATVQQLDRPGDSPRGQETRSPQHGQDCEPIEQHFRDKIGQRGKRFLRILADYGHPMLAADAAGSQRLTEAHGGETEQGILAPVRIVRGHRPTGLECCQQIDQLGHDRMFFWRQDRTDDRRAVG